jgi:RNA polymerase sigma factor (sigma-70 family)
MADGLVCAQAFDRLEDQQKDLLLLKYQGLTSMEIGNILGLSASAVRSRLQKAREALAGFLKDCGVDVE